MAVVDLAVVSAHAFRASRRRAARVRKDCELEGLRAALASAKVEIEQWRQWWWSWQSCASEPVPEQIVQVASDELDAEGEGELVRESDGEIGDRWDLPREPSDDGVDVLDLHEYDDYADEDFDGEIDDLRLELLPPVEEEAEEGEEEIGLASAPMFDEQFVADLAEKIEQALLQGPKYEVKGWLEDELRVWQRVRTLVWDLHGWWGRDAQADGEFVRAVMWVARPEVLKLLSDSETAMTRTEMACAILTRCRVQREGG